MEYRNKRLEKSKKWKIDRKRREQRGKEWEKGEGGKERIWQVREGKERRWKEENKKDRCKRKGERSRKGQGGKVESMKGGKVQ